MPDNFDYGVATTIVTSDNPVEQVAEMINLQGQLHGRIAELEAEKAIDAVTELHKPEYDCSSIITFEILGEAENE